MRPFQMNWCILSWCLMCTSLWWSEVWYRHELLIIHWLWEALLKILGGINRIRMCREHWFIMTLLSNRSYQLMTLILMPLV
jgi:hypothetical protein